MMADLKAEQVCVRGVLLCSLLVDKIMQASVQESVAQTK